MILNTKKHHGFRLNIYQTKPTKVLLLQVLLALAVVHGDSSAYTIGQVDTTSALLELLFLFKPFLRNFSMAYLTL